MATGQKISEQTAATTLGRSDLLTIVQSGVNKNITPNNAPQMAQVWVNFNGTGTVAIRDSYNVTSITDNGTGDYTVNFANELPNANYAYSLSGHNLASNFEVAVPVAISTTSFRMEVTNSGGTPSDVTHCTLIIFSN
jgi:hypothetical protein